MTIKNLEEEIVDCQFDTSLKDLAERTTKKLKEEKAKYLNNIVETRNKILQKLVQLEEHTSKRFDE